MNTEELADHRKAEEPMTRIRNFDDFCRELLSCGFSMGGGNAKGIFALIDYDWTNQDALDTPVKWHCGDPKVDPWEWRMRVLEERRDIAYSLRPADSSPGTLAGKPRIGAAHGMHE